jgi:DNA-binding PadR family transcriptional regulator
MSKAPRAEKTRLTENEGVLLALVLRQQPVKPYQLHKIYENSPISSINASKGQVYPAIRRLKERGLLESKKVEGDGRNPETLVATDAGVEAVRGWVNDIEDSHIVLDDPLRTRLLSLELLGPQERLEWVARAKALVKERSERVEAYDKSVTVPFQEHVARNARGMLEAKMSWLDELLYDLASRK